MTHLQKSHTHFNRCSDAARPGRAASARHQLTVDQVGVCLPRCSRPTPTRYRGSSATAMRKGRYGDLIDPSLKLFPGHSFAAK
jgi:hypothetical protein